ncbi:MAG: DUF1737 domain-containing protein [Desulfuromonadales bacterium]|nr:DUF1737 domain-containing protein [Desulfuromonadales bacterium]
MVTEYEVLSENDLGVLKTKVKEALGKGWQPYSCLQVSTPVVNGVVAPLFTQALVKVADPAQVEEEFLVK